MTRRRIQMRTSGRLMVMTWRYVRAARDDAVQDAHKQAGFIFLICTSSCICAAGPRRGEALPVLWWGDSCEVWGGGQSHVASCHAFLLRWTRLLISLQVLCAKWGQVTYLVYVHCFESEMIVFIASYWNLHFQMWARPGSSPGRPPWYLAAWSPQCSNCPRRRRPSWRSWWCWETCWRCPWMKPSTSGGSCRPRTPRLRRGSCRSWR